MPGYIELGGVRLYSYAILSAIGFIAVAVVLFFLNKTRFYRRFAVVNTAFWGVIGLCIGAHLLFGITQIPTLIEAFRSWSVSPPASEEVWSTLTRAFGGMVYYGGFLGLVAGASVWLRKMIPESERPDYYDLLAVSVPLFHVFGRLGCFAAGCCYGVECEWGIVCEHTLDPVVNGVPRFPVQLVEAAVELLIFDLLLFLFLRKQRRGSLLRLYALIYPVVRFVLEFFRDDDLRGKWGWLSTSQWASVLIFTVAILTELRERGVLKAQNEQKADK